MFPRTRGNLSKFRLPGKCSFSGPIGNHAGTLDPLTPYSNRHSDLCAIPHALRSLRVSVTIVHTAARTRRQLTCTRATVFAKFEKFNVDAAVDLTVDRPNKVQFTS